MNRIERHFGRICGMGGVAWRGARSAASFYTLPAFPAAVALAVALPVLLRLFLPVPLSAQSAVEAQAAVEGEYGLWVHHADEGLQVSWLTAEAEQGLLEVWVEGERVLREETPAGGAHRETIPLPPSDRFELRYGALDPAGAGLHSTVIRMDPAESIPSSVLPRADSLFVVGDIHGEYETLHRLLRAGGLVGEDGSWTGGRSHVVFLGDIFDRGPDVTRTLWFLYRLEDEAARAGGGAHVVLGNHEIMIFTHDTRYVSSKESLLARLHGTPYPHLFDVRRSVLGRWLARRPVYMKVDDVVMAHGGITPSYASLPVEEFNDSIRGYIAEDVFYEWGDTAVVFVADSADAARLEEAEREVLLVDSLTFERRSALFFGNESPLWFRGYVQSDTLSAQLEEVLDAYDARVHVVGHTPVRRIEPLYDGRVIPVDLADPATEMLLLTREGPDDALTARRIRVDGAVEPLDLFGPQ